MIETFAHRLAQKLISLSTKNTVTKDDIAVVSYGIECLLNLCIPFFFFLKIVIEAPFVFHDSIGRQFKDSGWELLQKITVVGND